MFQSLKNIYHLFVAILAALFYRFPARKLKVIGVTGTDGKTTTVHLIYHILKSAGKKVSMISTVKAAIGDKEQDTGLHVTTPSPWEVQRYFSQAGKAGSKYMVLEVTSHALDQNRIAFCNFLIGVLTNITHEHLDYHKTYERYIKTKLKLLRMSRIAVVNKDDESFKTILRLTARLIDNSIIKLKIKGEKLKIITYGIKNEADFTPQNFSFKAPLSGEFNEYNTLAAIAVCKNLGVENEKIREALLSFQQPEGRMEVITQKPFSVMIDFAHTPNALEKVLYTCKYLTAGRVIVVFGCAGERDQAKRFQMGEIAAKGADYTVLTTEDPRSEDLYKIIDQIAQGCIKGGSCELELDKIYQVHQKPAFFRIPDRQEAINFAIQKLAHTGDLVVITGKGHEKSMCFGNKEYYWSDHEAVGKALARLK